MTSKNDDAVSAILAQIVALSKEQKELEKKISDTERKSHTTRKTRSDIDAGNINARNRYIHLAKHYTATDPNYEQRKYRGPKDNETHQFGTGHLDNTRLIMCECHRIWRPEKSVVYVMGNVNEPPKWVCRDFAREWGLAEYVVRGNGHVFESDRRRTNVPKYTRRTISDTQEEKIVVKLLKTGYEKLDKKLIQGSTHYAVHDERGYVIRNIKYRKFSIDLVLKESEIEVMRL